MHPSNTKGAFNVFSNSPKEEVIILQRHGLVLNVMPMVIQFRYYQSIEQGPDQRHATMLENFFSQPVRMHPLICLFYTKSHL